MTSDICIDAFTKWLVSRKYKKGTIYNYVRPMKIMAEKGMAFSDVEALGADDFYHMITGHRTSFRHSARAMYQSVHIYREFLDRTQNQTDFQKKE